uniref:tRNA (N(6)-L-threonylcarbamoyladenosine(37)-C(2))-methylthiotransferase n=1 Tax=Macrostomum lignano TaxID=282301 RepID=A0A1I8IMF7_9PLAT
MAGLLSAYGYSVTTDQPDQADLWLLNSCTVKTPAEHHARNEIQAARQAGKAIVVAGCVPQGQPDAAFLRGVSLLGVGQVGRVVEVVEETLRGNSVRLLGKEKSATNGRRLPGPPLDMPKIRRNPLIEIVPINSGCLNSCTYCKTKHARGQLSSYQPDQIVHRVASAFAETPDCGGGACEVWLTSEDTGAYGIDIGVDLPSLLDAVVDAIPSGGMLRLGMTNPPYILRHLPASGSDAVLGEMRREYTLADFCTVVDYLRDRVPGGVTIATDIIAGFPTETEDDFEATCRLIEKYKFPVLFINQFFPRPGTPAARMHREATPAEVKDRTRRLNQLFRSYTSYDDQLGSVQDILVTDVSHDKQHWVGHNKRYEQILLPMNQNWLGRWIRVRILATGKHHMMAEPVDCSFNRSSSADGGARLQPAVSSSSTGHLLLLSAGLALLSGCLLAYRLRKLAEADEAETVL